MTATLLVAGTSSGAGKTVVVTGLCRVLARRGVKVAPFKAQNMSLNSFVTDDGEEIARAQAAQAMAAGVVPRAAMNPVLLKPGTDVRSQLVVRGRALGERDAARYWREQRELLGVVLDAHAELSRDFDVVVAEGAGSPAEINLRETDIVNMGFARAVGAPVVLVGDVDRGGVFASFVGTLALLDAEDQALVRGFVVNRFRGDRALLAPGLDSLAALTGRPVLGVLPYVHGLALDSEDSLDLDAYRDPAPPAGDDVLRVAVVWLPRTSNHTDLDALACEPGVVVRFVTRPEELADADLVVVPGTRATVDDLAWLRSRGLDVALVRRARDGRPTLGICGGYEMLGTSIVDGVESGRSEVPGIGLLPVTTRFSPDKVVRRVHAVAAGEVVHGYEIHHGRVAVHGGEPFVGDASCRAGLVAGTLWHGLFENDGLRRAYLLDVAARAGRAFVPAPGTSFATVREARLDRIADLLEEHVDVDALVRLTAATVRAPTVRLSLDP